jgi:hypothetical protein
LERLVLEPGTWTGDDVFEPRGLAEIMAPQRFKDACDRHGIKNAEFRPAEEAGHDFYPGEASGDATETKSARRDLTPKVQIQSPVTQLVENRQDKSRGNKTAIELFLSPLKCWTRALLAIAIGLAARSDDSA